MSNQKVKVKGIEIQVNAEEYISITDIAKSANPTKPADIIARWLQNQKTLLFLETWEQVHNPDFKLAQMGEFRLRAVSERFSVTPKKYIEETGAIGITSRAGRYGGTYAHIEIAVAFSYWLDPVFQVYFLKEFNRLKTQDVLNKHTDWTLEKILSNSKENYYLTETLQKLLKEKNKKLD